MPLSSESGPSLGGSASACIAAANVASADFDCNEGVVSSGSTQSSVLSPQSSVLSPLPCCGTEVGYTRQWRLTCSSRKSPTNTAAELKAISHSPTSAAA